MENDGHTILPLAPERNSIQDVQGASGSSRSTWTAGLGAALPRQHRDPRPPARRWWKKGALRALGRSRGGFGTKIHLRTDRKGNPIVFTLTGGEKHDAPQSVKPVDTGAVNGTRPGRPRLRPARIAGDKGYDSAALRMALRQRHIEPIIPSRCNRRRQIAFDKIRYRERNVIERCINKLKQWRRVATRYEKLAANYAAVILIAVSMRFLNILL